MSKDALLREMEAGFADLLSTVDGLSEEQMTRVWYGNWSVPDILAHIAGWHREEIAMLERIARGERPVPESADYTDDDAWNARFVAKWRAASAGEVLAELKASKEAYVAAAGRLPEERFKEGRTAHRLVQQGCTEHYREHAGEIREWRQREGI
ncbi:MAG: ClbS/DfsB family four-helix bundle protein [Dehalococcoidia bacterium]|nr:ClbS/DfsB family four-helix bundle protein [Dehalococcoidia bacterium]